MFGLLVTISHLVGYKDGLSMISPQAVVNVGLLVMFVQLIVKVDKRSFNLAFISLAVVEETSERISRFKLARSTLSAMVFLRTEITHSFVTEPVFVLPK